MGKFILSEILSQYENKAMLDEIPERHT